MDLLGKSLHVEVDRPVGYCHHGIVYPINYGYVPGMMAADGEEQDAYILGVSEPVGSFDGRVIGVIHRRDDCEDKLVLAPEEMSFHQGQIAEAVAFQEQFFDSEVCALFQKSCGVIPFRQAGKEPEFLVLFQRASQTWSFPKGHMEAGETEIQTALREMQEETGLQAVLLPDKSVTVSYTIGGRIQKQMLLFLGQVQGVPTVQREEIEKYRWVTRKDLSRYLHPDTAAAVEQLLARR